MDSNNLYYFEEAPIKKAIPHFALPMILGTSMSVIYSVLNAYFLGTLHDSTMLTALALTLPLFAIIMALGHLVGVGGGAFISRLLGEKRYDVVKSVSSFTIYISLAFGILFIAVALPFMDQIVSALGATPQSFEYTKDYISIMILGSPIVILFFNLENLIRSEGAAITSMIGMIISVIVKL